MRFLARASLYIFLLLMVCTTCVANIPRNIKDSVYYFKSVLAPGIIHFSLQKFKYGAIKDRRFDFGLTTDQYCYILLKIEADRPLESYMLSIDNTSLDTVFIYILSPAGGKTLLYQGGNLIDYDLKRKFVWHTISLAISEKPNFYLIAVKAVSKNVNLTYKILKEDELDVLYRSFDRLIFTYLGIILIILFTCLIGYLLFWNKALSIYACYILSVTFWILSHYGYFYPALYPSFPRMNDVIKPVSSLMAILFLLTLIKYLLSKDFNDNLFPKTINTFKLVIGITILAAFVHLIIPYHSNVYTIFNLIWHVIIIIAICLAIIIFTALFKRSKTARLFCLGVLLPLIMALLQIFSNAGYINNNFLNDHGLMIANLFEILVLSVVIIHNIWEDKRKKEMDLHIMEEEQKKTLQMLINVQDAERKTIAEELHDSIGPMLAAIKINFLRVVKSKLDNTLSEDLAIKTENIIDESITEIRSISHHLMPKGLSSKGLITLLSEYFFNLQTVYNTTINFSHSITTSLDKEIQLNLYRIICELALNAAKHSNSKNITALIETSATGIHVMIQDDGKGFNAFHKKSASLGLKNVESRVAYLRGSINIKSSMGVGTTIEILISTG